MMAPVGDPGRGASPRVRALRCWVALAFIALPGNAAALAHADARAAEERWHAQALATTIVRDDWGIAHIHGKSDADAVFGMAYAQAEDDFGRVETDYLNALGRLAETEGRRALYEDLR